MHVPSQSINTWNSWIHSNGGQNENEPQEAFVNTNIATSPESNEESVNKLQEMVNPYTKGTADSIGFSPAIHGSSAGTQHMLNEVVAIDSGDDDKIAEQPSVGKQYHTSATDTADKYSASNPEVSAVTRQDERKQAFEGRILYFTAANGRTFVALQRFNPPPHPYGYTLVHERTENAAAGV